MILPGESLGSSHVYCVNGLDCLNMFYFEYVYELTPYALMCKYYIYTYTLMWYMQYLLSVTVHWFCFGVGDYPRSVWLLNPTIYSFFPKCESCWWFADLYFNMQFIQIVYIHSRLNNATIELCNSFLSIHEILKRKVMYCTSFESLCKAVWADHLLGHYHL